MNKDNLIISGNIVFGIGLEIVGAYSIKMNPILAPFSLIITLIGAGMAWSALETRARHRLGRTET